MMIYAVHVKICITVLVKNHIARLKGMINGLQNLTVMAIQLVAPNTRGDLMRALVNWRKVIEKRIKNGEIEVCPACGKMSAYYWGYVDKRHDIAHIPASSSFEWQCGHCLAFITEKDSPINAECYTHIPRNQKRELDEV